MNLSTQTPTRSLSRSYRGRRVYIQQIINRPVCIRSFEITKSKIHPGKEMLIMNVLPRFESVMCVVITESYTLIDTIRGTESSLPHTTKIIRKRDGYYYFVELNEIEKNG